MTDAPLPGRATEAEHLRSYFVENDPVKSVSFFAPNAVWYATGPAGMNGEFRGREGVGRFLGTCLERSDGTLRIQLEAELSDGDYTVAFLRMTGRNATGELDAHVAQFMTHNADGQFERCWFLAADTAAWNAFFAV